MNGAAVPDRVERATIDATPDGNYALRILEHYRRDCDTLWSSGVNVIAVGGDDNPLINVMNEHQRQRAIELDAAIAKLRGSA